MPVFVTRYDFRAPGATPAERHELFTRVLKQAAYVDDHGHDALTLSEHHASEDGYLPSPLVAASAIAAVTKRIPISISALLANLHDPVRLAEDIAVLDHISGGRVGYTFGLGYRSAEYALFEREWSTRGKDLDANLAVLLAALRGEPVERGGRSAVVTPAPYSQPHPMMLVGGGSVAAARRAARFGLGFAPQVASTELKQAYLDACAEAGVTPGLVLSPPRNGPATIFCSKDPDTFWERWGHHLLHDANAYRAWREEGDRDPRSASHIADSSSTVAEMRSAGICVVLHPDDLIGRLRRKEMHVVTSHPACGGLPAEPSWEHLRLLSETVMPAVRPL